MTGSLNWRSVDTVEDRHAKPNIRGFGKGFTDHVSQQARNHVCSHV